MTDEPGRDRAVVGATLRRALSDAVPLFLSVVPFGLVFGLAVTESGVNHVVGWSSSWLVFGGAAQLTLISLLGSGSSVVAAVLAALVVNARHLMYSAALAPIFSAQPRWFRWCAPYLLIDHVFALVLLRDRDAPAIFRWYYLGVGVTFWLGWQVTTAAGLVIGPVIPDAWNLSIAVPILFVGLIARGIDTPAKLVAALAAGGATWLASGLPHRTGLLVGAVLGLLCGLIVERLRP